MFFDTINFGASHWDISGCRSKNLQNRINSFINDYAYSFNELVNDNYLCSSPNDKSYNPTEKYNPDRKRDPKKKYKVNGKYDPNYIIRKITYRITLKNKEMNEIYIIFRLDEGTSFTKKVKISADLDKFKSIEYFHQSLVKSVKHSTWEELIDISTISRLDTCFRTNIKDFNYFKDRLLYRYPREESSMIINLDTEKRTLYLGGQNLYLYEKKDGYVKFEQRSNDRRTVKSRLGLYKYRDFYNKISNKSPTLYKALKSFGAFTSHISVRELPDRENINTRKPVIKKHIISILDDLAKNVSPPFERKERQIFPKQWPNEKDRDYNRRMAHHAIKYPDSKYKKSYRKEDAKKEIHCNSLSWWSWKLNKEHKKLFSNGLAKNHFKKAHNIVRDEYLKQLKTYFKS